MSMEFSFPEMLHLTRVPLFDLENIFYLFITLGFYMGRDLSVKLNATPIIALVGDYASW